MLVAHYATKKQLKASINTRFHFTETSIFGAEFAVNKPLTVVGPSEHQRNWFAIVTVNEQKQITSVK